LGWTCCPSTGTKKELYLAGNQLAAVNAVVDTRVEHGACLVIFLSKSFLIFIENRLLKGSMQASTSILVVEATGSPEKSHSKRPLTQIT
jgi:precorrin-4 methylase